MMRKPSEITDDEWEMLTSPENYYMDGEIGRSEADRIFRSRVERIIASRRAAKAAPKSPHPQRRAPVGTVASGQVWLDTDPTMLNRKLMVVTVRGGNAVVRRVTVFPSGTIKVQSARTSSIRMDRFTSGRFRRIS